MLNALLPLTILAAILDGQAKDVAIMTDASQPPALRTLGLRSFELDTLLTYDTATLSGLGVRGMSADVQLRPAGIALLEGAYADVVFWADAGAGVILAARLDGTGVRLMERGLIQPEPLVLDASHAAYAAVEGYLLYWADIGANKISRCRIPSDLSVAAIMGNCTSTSDVLTDVAYVSSLALDRSAQRLFWSDASELSIKSALIEQATGAALVATTLVEAVPFVAMPVAIALEMNAVYDGSRRLYYLDQQRPARLHRLWLNGNGSQTLKHHGLSLPRAVAVAPNGFYCVVDSGTKELLLASVHADYPYFRSVELGRGGVAVEPRGVAVRSDASLPVSLDGPTTQDAGATDYSAAGRRRGGAAGAAWPRTAAQWAATSAGLAVAVWSVHGSASRSRHRSTALSCPSTSV